MGGIQQELVFRGDFEVLEAVGIVRRSDLVEMRPSITDRQAKLRSNAFESSRLMSVCTTDGSVPVFWFETVGD